MKKRSYLYILIVVLAAAGYYIHEHWEQWQRNSFTIVSSTQTANRSNGGKAVLKWQVANESSHGFQVEVPSRPVETTVQATNEHGAQEPVKMMITHPDTNSAFAVAWEDNPPVARVNGDQVDAIFDAAKTQAISATYTSQLSDRRDTDQGYPARQFVAKNASGGYLDARFIWAAPRLYMLIATYPTGEDRSEADITHFFQSFKIVRGKNPAAQKARQSR
jgi:hypothetical protein